jgi:UDP-N-acetyl-alpha-D-muramoyl-L-alanyl-L-glutamate epimerase
MKITDYHRFIFESYVFEREHAQIRLRYSFDHELFFEEVIALPSSECVDYDPSVLDRALFSLHLIAGISYYKAVCPPVLDVRSGSLSKAQAQFWNTTYTRGLGEFFYRNAIDYRDLIHFPYTNDGGEFDYTDSLKRHAQIGESGNVLVPFGGGKDSLVTAELLKRHDVSFDFFRIGTYPLAHDLSQAVGARLITIERTLDSKLFELNKQGAYNGHVPITAYEMFLSVVYAILYGYSTVVWSNEKSASVGNVEYLGSMINHQFSKSIDFERSFIGYIDQFVTQDVHSFSLLRPWHELAIARYFSTLPAYFSLFRSCNRNFTITSRTQKAWCRRCPKCAFIFMALAAFLPKQKVVDIFGGNMLADDSLLDMYLMLLGQKGEKPFECVGTYEENKAAFYLISQKGEFAHDAIVKHFDNQVLPLLSDPDALVRNAFRTSDEHCIPDSFLWALNAFNEH